jgi:hypothetical protein
VNYADNVAHFGRPASITGGPTSYWSAPSAGLDPTLFVGTHIKPWVRNAILSLVHDHFQRTYEATNWYTVWLAGSGVSFAWAADRHPGDLDCLIGVDFVRLRETNPRMRGFSDPEITDRLNVSLHDDLSSTTESWNGFEVTFYVNRGASDIRAINPYAAYNLTTDSWTVEPDPAQHAPSNPSWDVQAQQDLNMAQILVQRYSRALTAVQSATNPAHRRNAEEVLQHTLDAASGMYEQIHGDRKWAFAPTGAGYADFHNYRWQAGKRSGVVPALKALHDYRRDAIEAGNAGTYGVELPTSALLIARAIQASQG